MIRDQAKKAGKTVSGYLIDPGLNDDPNIHPLVLSPDDQKEIKNPSRICFPERPGETAVRRSAPSLHRKTPRPSS